MIYINAFGRCIFHSINLKYYENARFFICEKILAYCQSAVNIDNGGVKNKILKNWLIFTGKNYKRKLHTKHHIDWIKIFL